MDLEDNLVYLLVGFTSLGISILGIKRFGLKPVALYEALTELAECAGASVVFFVLNSVIGICLVLIARQFRFLSFYALADPELVLLSILQGLMFQLWWRRSRNG
jgi:hypothetical protein